MTSSNLIARALRKLNLHRTTELYFVGYPKSGNTWLRYMLGRYVQLACGLSETPLFDAADRWGRCESYCVGPAMQFTHRPLLWTTQRADDLTVGNVIRPFTSKRVVLLTRHPLDTIVSLWMQRRHRGGESYAGTLVEMLDDPVWGIEKYFRFYTIWGENRRKVREVMVLRYENMRADPHAVFRKLLNYLSIPIHAAALGHAVAEADFDSMKQFELSGNVPRYQTSGQSIFATGDANNADALHVRRGKVGGYRDYLADDQAERLENLINDRLPQYFGYSQPL